MPGERQPCGKAAATCTNLCGRHAITNFIMADSSQSGTYTKRAHECDCGGHFPGTSVSE